MPDKKELLNIANILRSQIDNNWTRPPGIKNIENLSFKLIISLDPNGNVINIKVPLRTENLIKKNVFLKPYLNSAIRAIKKTSPFEGLEKHRYNIWKSNIINYISIFYIYIFNLMYLSQLLSLEEVALLAIACS